MQTSKKQNKPVTNLRQRSRNPNGQPKPYRDGNRWKAPGFVVDSAGNRYSVIGTGSTMVAAMIFIFVALVVTVLIHERRGATQDEKV